MVASSASRGGAKPRMIQGSEDWGLDTGGGYPKKGIYEYAPRLGELARRVELPHWLAQERDRMGASFLAALGSGAISCPAEEIGESRGHIFVSPPPEFGWPGSAVGVDEPIFERLARLGSEARFVRFAAYAPGYRLAFQWRIEAAAFLAKAKRVQTKPQFMPQMMVGVDELRPFVAR